MESPEQPMEDNTAFKMLPIVVAVVVVALALLYFVAQIKNMQNKKGVRKKRTPFVYAFSLIRCRRQAG